MAVTYTDSLRLTQQEIGSNENTWGNVLNDGVIGLIDTAISGRLTVGVTRGTDITLTTNNGSTDQARNMTLYLSGTPSANISVIVPTVPKIYVVQLNIAGSHTVTVRTSSGTGVAFKANPVDSTHIVLCDGTNVSEISVPQGTISMWSGTVATVPSGYVFCNGTNNTPDLRNKFIVGARQDSSGAAKTNLTGSLTQSGGSLSDITSGSGGNHNHGGETGSTTLTVDQIPSHFHEISKNSNNSASGSRVAGAAPWGSDPGTINTQTTGGGQGHDHSISSSGAHTHTVTPNPPPYYALAYIMRV